MATRDADYTKTGNGWLASLANKISFIPFTGFITAPMLMLDGGFSAIGWALRGKFASAATALGSGVVAGGTAALSDPGVVGIQGAAIFWAGNALSGMTTGRSLNTHARALTESATSMVTRPLGMQPTVLRSYYAGVGGTGGADVGQRGPGRFTTQVANERGQNANAMYNSYMRGEGGAHVNELASAQGRGA